MGDTDAETWREAFDRLHSRVSAVCDFDANESAAPDDERWAIELDRLAAFAHKTAHEAEKASARLAPPPAYGPGAEVEDDGRLTVAELVMRLTNPSGPEDLSDVVAELARRMRQRLDQRGTTPIDEAAIVRNFARAVAEMRVIVEAFVGSDSGHHEADWLGIREHLDQAAAGLGWIAEAWI